MAMTATIALTPTSNVFVGQKIVATVVISNSGGSDVTVSSFEPYYFLTPNSTVFTQTEPIARGKGILAYAQTKTVPASGTLNVNFPIVFNAPSGDLSLSGASVVPSTTWSVGCTIVSSDGSVFKPTAATVTVNPVQQAPGQFP